MKSRLRMPRKRRVEKAPTSATAVLDLTTPFLEEGTHHQDRASTSARRRPSNNGLEEDHDIWDPRGRALGAAVLTQRLFLQVRVDGVNATQSLTRHAITAEPTQAARTGRAVPTARAPAPTSRRTASSTRCDVEYHQGRAPSARPRLVFRSRKKENATSPTCTGEL